jgi:dihydroorotate dehydrogenase (NAD+) catalytic subunit
LAIEFFGKTLSGPFTIPSGIVTTATPIIQYVFDHMPQVGVVTTKSIGLAPRVGNREPVYSQYAPGCFVNAVGLTNPGAEASRETLAVLRIPADRFLLPSIFGGSIEEFVAVAKILAPERLVQDQRPAPDYNVPRLTMCRSYLYLLNNQSRTGEYVC